MITTYQLNTSNELESVFINSVKATYPNQIVEIQVREQDETEYLLSSPVNRERLEKAVKNIEAGKNLISFDTLEQAMEAAAAQPLRQ